MRECNYGKLNGVSAFKFKSSKYYINNKHPGGENYLDVERRINNFLIDVAQLYPGKRIALVSHRAPQLALEVLLNGKTWEEAVMEDWRIKKQWQPGWKYIFKELASMEAKPGWEQDPDVLDTWFSSGQWPYATLGYPNTKDYKTFYPTDVMETGWDILFFWVARMIMLGLYRTDKVPFRTVYLHGLVRDKDRQKMSKSKGNVTDPLGVAEQYGTDAVRMALVIGNLPGNDIIISEEKIRGYRNFANKIWNIHRFIMLRHDATAGSVAKGAKAGYSREDKRRLAELKTLVKRVTSDLERYHFHHAAEILYHYVWHTFADKIIESAKPRLESANEKDKAVALSLLLEIHSTILKLLHPFMPFLTEELWSHLPGNRELLIVQPWPR